MAAGVHVLARHEVVRIGVAHAPNEVMEAGHVMLSSEDYVTSVVGG